MAVCPWLCGVGDLGAELWSEHPCTGAGPVRMLQLGWSRVVGGTTVTLSQPGMVHVGGDGWARCMEKPCEEEEGELAPAKPLQLGHPLVRVCAAGGPSPSPVRDGALVIRRWC